MIVWSVWIKFSRDITYSKGCTCVVALSPFNFSVTQQTISSLHLYSVLSRICIYWIFFNFHRNLFIFILFIKSVGIITEDLSCRVTLSQNVSMELSVKLVTICPKFKDEIKGNHLVVLSENNYSFHQLNTLILRRKRNCKILYLSWKCAKTLTEVWVSLRNPSSDKTVTNICPRLVE